VERDRDGRCNLLTTHWLSPLEKIHFFQETLSLLTNKGLSKKVVSNETKILFLHCLLPLLLIWRERIGWVVMAVGGDLILIFIEGFFELIEPVKNSQNHSESEIETGFDSFQLAFRMPPNISHRPSKTPAPRWLGQNEVAVVKYSRDPPSQVVTESKHPLFMGVQNTINLIFHFRPHPKGYKQQERKQIVQLNRIKAAPQPKKRNK
jgi:hypothetical protein